MIAKRQVSKKCWEEIQEMEKRTEVHKFMFEYFNKVTVSNNGTHFHARCILCGDSKDSKKKRFHLDWSPKRAIYICWSCGETGTFDELYDNIINARPK